MTRRTIIALAALLFAAPVFAQRLSVTESVHNLGPDGPGTVKGSSGYACFFCHAPHNAMAQQTPLWNHELSTQVYTPYSSSTYAQTGVQPQIANPTKLCLSCHDGSIAPGQTVSGGPIPTSGSLTSPANLGSDLRASHPVSLSLPLADNGEMRVSLLGSPPQTGDPLVQLPQGQLECTTCHDPHTPNMDPVKQKFLVRDASNGQLCLACHDPNRPTAAKLRGWSAGQHALAAHTTGGNSALGGYATVAANACSSCHGAHNAGTTGRLLRQPEEATCAACHSGTNLNPVLLDVMAAFTRSQYRHPVELSGSHDAAENAFPLNTARHAECADCHNSHAAQGGSVSAGAPASQPALLGATGVSGTDGATPLRPAVNQYEICFKCHANSTNKPQSTSFMQFGRTPYRLSYAGVADPYNVRLDFLSQVASHNVMHPARGGVAPSLRANMLDFNGNPSGRSMAAGTYLYCTDCHNSDAARQLGGNGANGPHGSIYNHILERRYEIESAPATPGGSTVGVSYTSGLTGTYAMCDKCHDVDGAVIGTDVVFRQHRKHVVDKQTSCATCHAPHGVQQGAPNFNSRLINPDAQIVGPNSLGIRQIDTAARTCSLSCHGKDHVNEPY